MAKKSDEAPLDGGFCWCSREIAAIIVISIVGMSMLVPGFLLRLEDADSPTPYLAVNLCQTSTSGVYVVSGVACTPPAAGSGSAQTIALNPVLLVNGVSYVPAVIRSSSIVSGSITANLVDSTGNSLFQFTSSLQFNGNGDTGSFVDLAQVNAANAPVAVFRPRSVFPTQNMLCDDVRNGCTHLLADPQNKLIMQSTPFTVAPPTEIQDNLFAAFSTNLKLVISSATVTVPSGANAPEVYIIFQQLSLSALQSRGVGFIIGGVSILILALGLTCFHLFFQRRSEAAEGVQHDD